MRSIYLITIIFVVISFQQPAQAYIHSAPVILKGQKIKRAARYPIWMYRLFKSDANGVATQIPFQIDEINQWGDYVLDRGKVINKFSGNGVFDLQDELSFMGDDVGAIKTPTKFPENKAPSLLYEIRFDPPVGMQSKKVQNGAVYLGVYFSEAPKKLDSKYYVVFDPAAGHVTSSRYRYKFNPKNYLVAEGIELYSLIKASADAKPKAEPLIDSSTFYMKADLKYFLTLRANQDSINSELEAYKIGPIRSIVRVTFYYKFLKINFELGMYTEVSFFANSVLLPAVMYSPVDGAKSLNRGSGFYYGFALNKNPKDYHMQTNMPPYRESGVLDFLFSPDVQPSYWTTIVEKPTARSQGKMLYFEVKPSKKLLEKGSMPTLYREDVSGAELRSRNSSSPRPLGKSPVNLGMYFDLTKVGEGEHDIAFKLYFENRYDEMLLENFKRLSEWRIGLKRL